MQNPEIFLHEAAFCPCFTLKFFAKLLFFHNLNPVYILLSESSIKSISHCDWPLFMKKKFWKVQITISVVQPSDTPLKNCTKNSKLCLCQEKHHTSVCKKMFGELKGHNYNNSENNGADAPSVSFIENIKYTLLKTATAKLSCINRTD